MQHIVNMQQSPRDVQLVAQLVAEQQICTVQVCNKSLVCHQPNPNNVTTYSHKHSQPVTAKNIHRVQQ